MAQYPLVSKEIPQVLQDKTLIEKVRFFLEGQLKTSFFTNRGIDIVLGKDIHKVSAGVNAIKQLDGTWQTVSTRHTIGMMDKLNGIPVPIPNTKLIMYTGALSFFVNPNASEEKENYFELVKEALEEFTDTLRGASFSNTEIGYKFATNAEEYNSNNLADINGVEYIWYTTTVYVLSSINSFVGNDLTYKKKKFTDNNDKYEEIFPIERIHNKGGITESQQIVEGETAKQINNQNAWSLNLTLYWTFKTDEDGKVKDTIISDIIRWVEQPSLIPQNFPFSIEVEWPVLGKIVHDVIITQASLFPTIGNFIVCNIIYNKAKQQILTEAEATEGT